MLKNCAAIYKEKAPKSFYSYFGGIVVFVFAAKGVTTWQRKEQTARAAYANAATGAGRDAIPLGEILRPESLYTKTSSVKLRPR